MRNWDTVAWEACLLEPVRDRRLERRLRGELGSLPDAARYFLDCPWLVRALVAFDPSRLPLVHTSLELEQMIALVVSQENTCRYCYAATRGVLRILGFPDLAIRKLEDDLLTADLPARDRAALELARRVSRAAPLPGAAAAAPLLREGVGVEAVKEIAFLAALNVFYNRVATLPALPPEPMEALADRWYVRLGRPLIARFLRAQSRRAAPSPLQPEQRLGPFAPFVCALEPLPLAARLREVIDDLLRPSALGRRAKALVFAVVARGLTCPVSEQEAGRLLVEEGLRPEEIEGALANLGAPALDEAENAIVRFARETIWYEPVHVQRRARALAPRLDRTQLAELVGVAALANALCRLGLAIELSDAAPASSAIAAR